MGECGSTSGANHRLIELLKHYRNFLDDKISASSSEDFKSMADKVKANENEIIVYLNNMKKCETFLKEIYQESQIKDEPFVPKDPAVVLYNEFFKQDKTQNVVKTKLTISNLREKHENAFYIFFNKKRYTEVVITNSIVIFPKFNYNPLPLIKETQPSSLKKIVITSSKVTLTNNTTPYFDIKYCNYLDLSYDNIEALPESICLLVDLEYLFLRRNKLKSLPNDFTEFNRLKEIDLSENEFEIFPAVTLICSEHLEKLNLNNNYISALEFNLGTAKSQLKFLFLSQNKFKSIPKEIKNLEKIQYVYLDENSITEITHDIVEELNKTNVYVSLRNNNLDIDHFQFGKKEGSNKEEKNAKNKGNEQNEELTNQSDTLKKTEANKKTITDASDGGKNRTKLNSKEQNAKMENVHLDRNEKVKIVIFEMLKKKAQREKQALKKRGLSNKFGSNDNFSQRNSSNWLENKFYSDLSNIDKINSNQIGSSHNPSSSFKKSFVKKSTKVNQEVSEFELNDPNKNKIIEEEEEKEGNEIENHSKSNNNDEPNLDHENEEPQVIKEVEEVNEESKSNNDENGINTMQVNQGANMSHSNLSKEENEANPKEENEENEEKEEKEEKEENPKEENEENEANPNLSKEENEANPNDANVANPPNLEELKANPPNIEEEISTSIKDVTNRNEAKDRINSDVSKKSEIKLDSGTVTEIENKTEEFYNILNERCQEIRDTSPSFIKQANCLVERKIKDKDEEFVNQEINRLSYDFFYLCYNNTDRNIENLETIKEKRLSFLVFNILEKYTNTGNEKELSLIKDITLKQNLKYAYKLFLIKREYDITEKVEYNKYNEFETKFIDYYITKKIKYKNKDDEENIDEKSCNDIIDYIIKFRNDGKGFDLANNQNEENKKKSNSVVKDENELNNITFENKLNDLLARNNIKILLNYARNLNQELPELLMDLWSIKMSKNSYLLILTELKLFVKKMIEYYNNKTGVNDGKRRIKDDKIEANKQVIYIGYFEQGMANNATYEIYVDRYCSKIFDILGLNDKSVDKVGGIEKYKFCFIIDKYLNDLHNLFNNFMDRYITSIRDSEIDFYNL